MRAADLKDILHAELVKVGVAAEGQQLEIMAEAVAKIADELSAFGVNLRQLAGVVEELGRTGDVLLKVLVEAGFVPRGQRRLGWDFGDGGVMNADGAQRREIVAQDGWEAARLAALVAAERKVKVVVGDGGLKKRLVGELGRFGVAEDWVLGLEEVLASDWQGGLVLVGVMEELWPRLAADGWLSDGARGALGLPHMAWGRALGGAVIGRTLRGDWGRQVWVVTVARMGEEVLRRHGDLPAFDSDSDVTAAWRDLWQAKVGGRLGNNELGGWVPMEGQYPRVWSASMVQDLMVCPYKGYAERVLRMIQPPPLDEVRSARVGGIVVHAWLERAGREWDTLKNASEAEAVGMMLGLAEEVLAEQTPVEQAIWRPKMKRLAPELLALWRENLANGGREVVAVEERLEYPVSGVRIQATVDRLERGREGMVVVDFKTGNVPTSKEMEDGLKPQLPLEGWLVEALGLGEVQGLEHWKLRGYGREVVTVAGVDAQAIVPQVGEAMGRLVESLVEGRAFAAYPDPKNGGIVASGHCERCSLSGVCRRGAA